MNTRIIDIDGIIIDVVEMPDVLAGIADSYPLTPITLCYWVLANSCNRGGNGRLKMEYEYSDSPGNTGGKIVCTTVFEKSCVQDGWVVDGDTVATMVWTTVSDHTVTFNFPRDFKTVEVVLGEDDSRIFYPSIRRIVSWVNNHS